MEKKKESRSGMEIMNLLQVVQHLLLRNSFHLCVSFYGLSGCLFLRKRADNEGHGMGRKLITISIR